jgi:MFS transporter, putative metabolite:H+ symporter
MAEIQRSVGSSMSAGFVLGGKLDSIPFSAYHAMVIGVLGLVGFVEGYDLVMGGSLLVLAKGPLHMSPGEIRVLAVAGTSLSVVGGFITSSFCDHISRKTIMLVGAAAITFLTLLIPLVQTGEQLIVLRSLTGFAAGFAVSAPFPIATELMPAQHRRTFGAVYEVALAASFTTVPFVASLLSHRAEAFRLMALPGGLAFFVIPPLIWLALPESPRWYLRRGRTEAAVAAVNRIIRRAGNRVAALSPAGLGIIAQKLPRDREPLPPFSALFRHGQLRWTLVGISSYVFAGTAFFLVAVLLPKALVDQGNGVARSFTVATLVFGASIPGKAFTGYLMEIIGRRWTICYAMVGSLPGLCLLLLAHHAPAGYAGALMAIGGLITGFTALSAATAFRIYLAEQFPTALRGRGHTFGESAGRIFSGVLAPFLMTPYTGSATIFFGTILVFVSIGAFVPLLLGRETVGQLETFTEAVPEPTGTAGQGPVAAQRIGA